MYHDDIGRPHDACDWRDIADEIVVELVVECRVDRIETTDQEKRVAVCGRANCGLGADIAAAARPVVDNELLAEPLRQPLSDQAREDVGRAGRGEWHDQTHRSRRIGLRPCDARHCGQRGSACCEMQELAAGKFHSGPSAACDPMGTGTNSLSPFPEIEEAARSPIVHFYGITLCDRMSVAAEGDISDTTGLKARDVSRCVMPGRDSSIARHPDLRVTHGAGAARRSVSGASMRSGGLLKLMKSKPQPTCRPPRGATPLPPTGDAISRHRCSLPSPSGARRTRARWPACAQAIPITLVVTLVSRVRASCST